MKLMWFHLMPYTELPADFRDRTSSVWVDIDPKFFDPARGHLMYNDFMDELEHAAACGFDAVCVNEHHANGYGQMPSPNLVAASLARNTRDAALCIMGNSVALYNPPTRVAEEMAMIDCISGGRVIAGFPVGSPQDTCYAYGQNPSQLRQRYYEGIDLIRQAWTRDDVFAFDGRFTKQRYVNCWPRPVQRPHPPIWIPGGGSVETWRFCAEHDFVYSFLSYFGYKVAREQMHGYWAELRRLGKDTNPFRAGFLQFVGVAETRAEALRLYREPAEYFYGRCLHVDPKWVVPPGYMTEATIRARVQSQMQLAAKVSAGGGASINQSATDFAGIVDNGYVLVGSPDEVADKLREIALDLGVGHLMLLLQFGNMDKALTKYNTQLFADKVIPQLKDLFDNDWEDHWWVKPLAGAQRAACAVAA